MTGAVVCPRCSTVNPDSVRFCSNCGLERQGAIPEPPQPVAAAQPTIAPQTKPAIPRGLKLVGYAIVVIVVFSFVSGALSRPRGGGSGGGGTPAWEPPAGFTTWSGDRAIAFRWEEEGECIMDRCWHMTVVTKDGCPNSLYVELTTLTTGGTVVGYTNDSVGSVRAGEQAKLNFENLDEGASKARVGDISCY